jgi:hypothetical protein
MFKLFVYDIVLTGNDDEEIQNLRIYLANEFQIKNVGSSNIFSKLR